mgnify:CR=1 FL=1
MDFTFTPTRKDPMSIMETAVLAPAMLLTVEPRKPGRVVPVIRSTIPNATAIMQGWVRTFRASSLLLGHLVK